MNSRYRRQRTGFTAIELVILLVILALLAFALLPAIMRSRMAARMTMSKNNLAQLGKAMKYYEALGKGNVPPKTWEDSMKPYLDGEDAVFKCPLRDKEPRNGGVYSYAMYTGSESFGFGDSEKIAIVTSDHRLIDIETKKCVDGKPVITGEPVARYEGLVLALMYGGSVRAFEFDEIDPANESNEPLVIWWLPAKDESKVCGKKIEAK